MPSENERKFVLRLDKEDCIKEVCGSSFHSIQQSYLSGGARLRESCLNTNVGGIAHIGVPVYHFCYKKFANKRLIEIETEISPRDFHDLNQDVICKLSKHRYEIIGWEVDFFLDSLGKTYFLMAEYEMDEDQFEPGFFPDIILTNLIYEVPLGDDDFSSKKLCDIAHASQIYKNLLFSEGN